MTNNAADNKKQLANVDTATMWLGDAKAWMDMAERLDSESKQAQNADPTNHHKQSVAQACTGLAFELAYKSLLVAEFKMPEEMRSIEKLHNRLKVETQRVVDEWFEEAGWEESDDLLKFLDKYMAHPDIKYRLDNSWEKEKRNPGFTLTEMSAMPELAKILNQLVNLGKQHLAEARNMNTPHQLDSQITLNAVLEIIREIAEKSANDNYIYRGEPKYYDKVSSTLYRQYEDDIEAEHFEIEVAQDEMLTEAKDYIHETVDGFEILTQLQHYGGKTNLIDFTTDYLIALFFACDGFFDEPGRVILLRDEAQKKNQVEKPRSVINRVRDQKSIFARPPKGFIEIESDDAINIPEWLKRPMLKYLEKYHDISTKTIYNDLHGFIKVQDLHQSAYTEFYKGWTCQYKKQYDKAIEHYAEALKRNPQLAAVYNNRGAVYNENGEVDRAIEDFNRAIQLRPDYADAHTNRGLAYRKKGKYDLAIADHTKAIEVEPNDAKAYINRGVVFCSKNEYNLALANFTKAIQLRPDFAEAYYSRGKAHGDKGDIDSAIADYTKAIQLRPDYASAYNNRGLAYSDKGNYDRTIADYAKAIQLKPDYAEAYNNRGVAYSRKGDYDSAIVDYTKAIQLNPDYAEAYTNRGNVYGEQGDIDHAIADYTKAIELNPDFAGPYNNRGVAYEKKGNIDRAIEDYTRAIQLKPDYTDAYNNRGLAYTDKGDYNRAIEDYTKAIELKPDLAEVYAGRGVAWLHLKEWEKVRTDLMAARNMGADIIVVFQVFYASVPDFEQRNGVQLPADIAAMLTPQQ